MKKILPVWLIVFIFSLVNIASAADTDDINTNVNEQSEMTGNIEREIWALVNYERARKNLKPLKFSDQMNKYANIRAEEISKTFSHTRPNGEKCFTVIHSNYKMAGENIAAGQRSSKEVVEAWMNSTRHRDNIMNPNFKELGVGYVYIPNLKYKYYWVQLFRTK